MSILNKLKKSVFWSEPHFVHLNKKGLYDRITLIER